MTDGITNLDDCKAWVKEKYPMRGHKTGEMIRSLITEVELLRLATSQLEAKVYHTAPGQLEFAPEGWTWQQQCRAEHDRYVELEAECEAQSQRLTAATKQAEAWEAEARAARARLTPLGFAVLTVGPEVGSHPHLSAYAAARTRADALEGEKKAATPTDPDEALWEQWNKGFDGSSHAPEAQRKAGFYAGLRALRARIAESEKTHP